MELGEALCLSTQRINQLVKEGVLPAAIEGRYTPRDAVASYVRHLRQREAGKSQAGEAVTKMQLENEMRRIKLRRIARELVPVAQVQKDWFEMGRRVRDGLLNLPSRLSGVFAAEASQEKIFELFTKEIYVVLTELSSGQLSKPVTVSLPLEESTDPARSPGLPTVQTSVPDGAGAPDQEYDNLPTVEDAFLDRGDEDPDDRFADGD